jgi:hypothetical protein
MSIAQADGIVQNVTSNVKTVVHEKGEEIKSHVTGEHDKTRSEIQELDFKLSSIQKQLGELSAIKAQQIPPAIFDESTVGSASITSGASSVSRKLKFDDRTQEKRSRGSSLRSRTRMKLKTFSRPSKDPSAVKPTSTPIRPRGQKAEISTMKPEWKRAGCRRGPGPTSFKVLLSCFSADRVSSCLCCRIVLSLKAERGVLSLKAERGERLDVTTTKVREFLREKL